MLRHPTLSFCLLLIKNYQFSRISLTFLRAFQNANDTLVGVANKYHYGRGSRKGRGTYIFNPFGCKEGKNLVAVAGRLSGKGSLFCCLGSLTAFFICTEWVTFRLYTLRTSKRSTTTKKELLVVLLLFPSNEYYMSCSFLFQGQLQGQSDSIGGEWCPEAVKAKV